jgi:hypothetical protein
MRKNTPTSWIVFLFVTGFIFIGYGVRGGKKPVASSAQMTASIESVPETAKPSLTSLN